MNIFGLATNLFPWNSDYNQVKPKNQEQILSEVREAGYKGVEMSADLSIQPLLKRLGLQLSGSSIYVGGLLLQSWETLNIENSILKPAKIAAQMGAQYIVINADPKGGWKKKERKTEDELKIQGNNLTKIGEKLKTEGLKLALHNHSDTNQLMEDDFKSVLKYADPDCVGICLDTGWALTSNADPIDLVRRFGKRLFTLHLRNQKGSIPTEDIKEGDIDIPKFFSALSDIGYKGWITTELWHRKDIIITRSLLENQQRTVNFLLAQLKGSKM